MTNVKLPEGVTQEMVDGWKTTHGVVKLANLFNKDNGEEYGEVIVAPPGAQVINLFERNIDKDPLKAKLTLIGGTFLTRKEEAINCNHASPMFSAFFDAAAQMLPAGKATLKNL